MAEVPTMTVIDPADPAGEAIMVINKSDYDPKKYRLPGSPMPKLRRGPGSETAAATPPPPAPFQAPAAAPAKGNSIAAYDEPPPAATGKK